MKKGFTLIELLSVIVLIAIIGLITTPIINNTIKDSKKKAFQSSASGLYDTINQEYTKNGLKGTYKYTYSNGTLTLVFKNGVVDSTEIKTEGKLNATGDINIDSKGNIIVQLEDDNYCAYNNASDSNIYVAEGKCSSIAYNSNWTDASCFTFDKNTKTITKYDESCGTSVTVPEYFVIEGIKYNVENIGELAFINNYNEIIVIYNDTNGNNYQLPRDVAIDNSISYEAMYAVVTTDSTKKICHNNKTNTNELVNIDTVYTFDQGYDSCRITGITPAFGHIEEINFSYSKHLKKIEDNAFQFSPLTNLVIPNSVTSISDFAFGGNQLTSVSITDSVTSIGNFAFEGNQLASIAIPNSVTSIGDSAFEGNQLASIAIPNSVTSIGEYAFYYNQLTSVTIGNSVTSIGNQAFAENEPLIIIYNNSGNLFEWGSIVGKEPSSQNETGTIIHFEMNLKQK